MDINKLAREASMNQLLAEWKNLSTEKQNKLIEIMKSEKDEEIKSFLRQVIIILSTLNECGEI